jgi:hypothetical protein
MRWPHLKRRSSPQDFGFDLVRFNKNYYSQNGEDGILEEIFTRLNIREGWACEFGAWDGKLYSNTFALIERQNWKAVMIEADKKKFIDLMKTVREQPNIIPLCKKIHYIDGKGDKLHEVLESTSIPLDMDLLSIDIDSHDYHVWKHLEKYDPKVVIIECSGLDEEIIQREGAVHKVHYDGSTAFPPLKRLGEEKGYVLVCDIWNLIFVKKEFINLLKAGAQ